MYIDCMTPEEIKKYNERSKREFEKSSVFDAFKYNEPMPREVKWGILFPLFLFIDGISVPFFTDEIYVMWFALVPFYAYSFVVALVGCENEELSDNIVGAMAGVFMLSVLLAIIHCFVLSDMESNLATATLMGMFNIPMSFASMWALYFGRAFSP